MNYENQIYTKMVSYRYSYKENNTKASMSNGLNRQIY